MAKHSQNAKAPLRLAACESVGTFVWDKAPAEPSAAWKAFVELLVPAWKANLAAAGLALKAPAGPLEGYVVLALLKGRLASWDTPGIKALLSNEVAVSWADAAKPSFLLNDKIIRKATTDGERQWQLRALLVLAQTEPQADIIPTLSEALSLSVTGKSREARSYASVWLTALAKSNVSLAASVFQSAAVSVLKTIHAAPTSAPAADEETSKDPSAAFRPLFRVFTIPLDVDAVSLEQRQLAFEKLFVLAHVYSTGLRSEARGLAAGLHIDLADLINEHFPSLWQAVLASEQDPALKDAAYAALTTMVSIAPETSLAEIVSELEKELDASRFAALSADDLAIWATPAGELFHDVLAAQGAGASAPKGGQKVDKWEQDLRNELARKKAAAKVHARGTETD